MPRRRRWLRCRRSARSPQALGRGAHGGERSCSSGSGTTLYPVAVAGVIVTLVGLRTWHSARRRVARLTKAVSKTAETGDQAQMFGSLVDVVDRPATWPLSYAAFVEWNEDGSGGAVRFERGSHQPPESSIISWLLREAESGAGLVIDEGVELPSAAFSAALPLRRDNSLLVGFVVLCAEEEPSGYVAQSPRKLDRHARARRSARRGRRKCSGCCPRSR